MKLNSKSVFDVVNFRLCVEVRGLTSQPIKWLKVRVDCVDWLERRVTKT